MARSMGTVISDARKQKGLTQAELASELNVTDKAVSKWERDISCPDMASIPVLAKLLNIQLEELISGKSAIQKKTDLFELVCFAVSFAMGIAVFILAILSKLNLVWTPELNITDMMGLLAVGIAALALAHIRKSNT